MKRVVDGIVLNEEDVNITKEDINMVREIGKEIEEEMLEELDDILDAPETEKEKKKYDDIFDENKSIEEQVKTAHKYFSDDEFIL